MENGKWLNKENGYHDTKLYDRYWLWFLFPTAIYHFELDRVAPLAYVTPETGWLYRPNASFDSDRGSVPSFASILTAPDTFLVSYYMHDSGCRFGGLWVSKDGGTTWLWMDMTREQMDRLLWHMVRAEGGNQCQADAIYAGVRVGAFLGIGGQPTGSYRHKSDSLLFTRRYV